MIKISKKHPLVKATSTSKYKVFTPLVDYENHKSYTPKQSTMPFNNPHKWAFFHFPFSFLPSSAIENQPISFCRLDKPSLPIITFLGISHLSLLNYLVHSFPSFAFDQSLEQKKSLFFFVCVLEVKKGIKKTQVQKMSTSSLCQSTLQSQINGFCGGLNLHKLQRSTSTPNSLTSTRYHFYAEFHLGFVLSAFYFMGFFNFLSLLVWASFYISGSKEKMGFFYIYYFLV